MDRVLVDTSALIAMAQIGELELLVDLLGGFHVTPAVFSEATEPDEPGASEIRRLAGEGDERDEGSITVFGGETIPEDVIELGLGPGEASLIAACGPNDRLIIDDLNARHVAKARQLTHTGLLGLLVAGVDTEALSPERGLGVLQALARSDFHMTVDLYDWARENMDRDPG